MMRRTERLVVLLTIMSLLASCRSVQQVRDIALSSDGILVEMWGSKDCVAVGDTIRLRASVTNHGAKPFVVDLQDRPVLDLWVTKRPSILQRWSDGKPLTPDVTGLALQPGQSKTIEMAWIPAASVYGPVHAEAQYVSRGARGDNTTYSMIPIGVQFCVSGLGP